MLLPDWRNDFLGPRCWAGDCDDRGGGVDAAGKDMRVVERKDSCIISDGLLDAGRASTCLDGWSWVLCLSSGVFWLLSRQSRFTGPAVEALWRCTGSGTLVSEGGVGGVLSVMFVGACLLTCLTHLSRQACQGCRLFCAWSAREHVLRV